MNSRTEPKRKGAWYALLAALLFGSSTPFSKLLLNKFEPILLAGFLYLGSGLGLSIWSLLHGESNHEQAEEARLSRKDFPWLAGAILSGGVVGPIFLMVGLRITPASSVSMLLNLEAVFTAVLAWFLFKENFDRRIALGMIAIVLGGAVLSWSWTSQTRLPWGSIAIVGACLAWAIDNNLTRNVSSANPLHIAAAKGLVAGVVTLIIAFWLGASLPQFRAIGSAALLGFFAYGVSLALFVLALRYIGTARTGAYFSVAPFAGAAFSIVLLREAITVRFLSAAVLMVIGVWLHLTERHEHEHIHEAMEHEHRHSHDEHHQHHDDPALLAQSHTHVHRHERLRHGHSHYPDIHHRHEH